MYGGGGSRLTLTGGQGQMHQNAVHQIPEMFTAAVHTAAAAFRHQAAALHGRVAVDDPVAEFGHALTRGHEHVAHGRLIFRVDTHRHSGPVFQQRHGLQHQRAQNGVVFLVQQPASARADSRPHQLHQFPAPGIADGLSLGINGAQHHSQGLPQFRAKFFEFGSGLLHSGLKALAVGRLANAFGLFAHGPGLGQFGGGLPVSDRAGGLEGLAFADQLLAFGLGFGPGLFQHFLALGVGRAENSARPFRRLGAHPLHVVFLLFPQGLLHGVQLRHGGFALSHEDGAPFFAQFF